MAQNDFDIANQGFPSFRADLNSALQSLATLSSGATPPVVTYTYQLWYDTANDKLFIRNEANDGWLELFGFDQAAGVVRLGPNDAVKGLFHKTDSSSVAWERVTETTAQTNQQLFIEVESNVISLPPGTPISMPTLNAGTDYAIWCTPDGDLEADASFSSPPTANSRRVGGFHFAPGGNAPLDPLGNWDNHNGGDTTPQINEYSFYDLRWKPSAPDPRGLTLVNNSFWTGMYLMSAGDGAGPLHRYNVDPCRDGNAPFKPYATTPTRYTNAIPMNIFEVLAYNGFRAPDVNEFQLLAIGVNEQRSIGGSGPGNTGIVADRSKNQQTSAWGVFDATGVLEVWGRDSLPDNVQDDNVTQGRSNNV